MSSAVDFPGVGTAGDDPLDHHRPEYLSTAIALARASAEQLAPLSALFVNLAHQGYPTRTHGALYTDEEMRFQLRVTSARIEAERLEQERREEDPNYEAEAPDFCESPTMAGGAL